MMRVRTHRRTTPRRGAALIIVIWTIAISAIFASSVQLFAWRELQLAFAGQEPDLM